MLRDRYTKRFPEIDSLNLTSLEYARTVLAIGAEEDLTKVDYGAVLSRTIVLAIAMPASSSMGRPLPPSDLTDALFLAQTIVDAHQSKQRLLIFLEERMTRIAPNVSAIVGTKIASQLIAITGSITALAKVPAGNIHVLGRAAKKELAGFSLSHVNPHAGVIFECDLVASTPPQYRTQAQRLISNKVALAARIDSQHQYSDASYGRSLRQEIINRLEKLIEPAPMSKVKPIPPPPIESSKKRGGRRARRQKELYGQSQLRKMTNRMEFGKAEEEIIVGSSVVGLGELSSGSAGTRRLRPPAADNKLREHLKKQSERAYAGFLKSKNDSKPTLVTLSSPAGLKVSASEGIELRTDVGKESKSSAPPTKYFGDNLSFRK